MADAMAFGDVVKLASPRNVTAEALRRAEQVGDRKIPWGCANSYRPRIGRSLLRQK